MLRDELANLAADFVERLLPGDLFEALAHALEWHPEAVGRVVNLVVAKPLDAGVAATDDVVCVRFEADDSVTVQSCSEATGSLANPAKGLLSSACHGEKVRVSNAHDKPWATVRLDPARSATEVRA